MPEKRRIIIIGIDGADPFLVEFFCKQGHLPTFEKIMKRGVFGRLRTVIPPLSPIAWTSFSTGVNPGKHGIFGFYKLLFSHKGFVIKPVSTHDVKSIYLWQLLSKYGMRTIVFGLPLTYPPRKFNGILVPGILAPPDFKTWPPNFKLTLLKHYTHFRLYPDIWFEEGFETLYLQELFNLLKLHIEVCEYLLMNFEYDLFIGVLYYLDQIQHFYWRFFDKDHELYKENASQILKDAILTAYKMIDKFLSKVLKMIDSNDYLIIVSDHGHTALLREVYLNSLLEKLGLLEFHRTIGYILSHYIIQKFLSYFGKLSHKLFLSIGHLLFENKYVKKISRKIQFLRDIGCINIERTSALAVGHAIYILDKHRRNQIYKVLKSFLSKLRDPLTGNKIITGIYKREEIYWGPYVNYAPDIILLFQPGYSAPAPGYDFTPHSSVITLPLNKRSSEHTLDGIFMMYGSHLKVGAKNLHLNILDIASLVLYLLGVPIPNWMDGKIPIEIFEEKSLIAQKFTVKRKEKCYINSIIKKIRMDLKKHNHNRCKYEYTVNLKKTD